MMKKTKKGSRKDKLSLKRETLQRLTRTLGEAGLKAVNGGGPCGTGSIVPSSPN